MPEISPTVMGWIVGGDFVRMGGNGSTLSLIFFPESFLFGFGLKFGGSPFELMVDGGDLGGIIPFVGAIANGGFGVVKEMECFKGDKGGEVG